MVLICILIAVIIVVSIRFTNRKEKEKIERVIHNEDYYEKAAVAADNKQCSEMGRDTLLKGGNAIDAAVTTLFCLGLYNMHSCGIGGGGFMNYYSRAEQKSYIINFRETAPASAHKMMYVNSTKSSRWGKYLSLIL